MKLQEAWDASEGRGVRQKVMGKWKDFGLGDEISVRDAVCFASWEPILPEASRPRDWCDEVASTAWVRGLIPHASVDKVAELIRAADKQACKFYEYQAKKPPAVKPAPDYEAMADRVCACFDISGIPPEIFRHVVLVALKGT